MHSFLFDLRFTLRELRRRPTFTLTAILLSRSRHRRHKCRVSASFTPFSSTLSPIPVPIASWKSACSTPPATIATSGLNGPQLQLLRQAKSVESIAGMDYWNLTTNRRRPPRGCQDLLYLPPTTPGHWGTKALMGRWLMPSDAPFGKDAQPVVVIGYKFWQRYYLGDPNVIGRTLQLVHKPYQIVGVMPPRFKWADVDMYLPLHVTNDPHIYFNASLKLRPGVTTAQASSELQPYLEQFAKESPERYPEKFRANLRSITQLYAMPLGPTLYLLLGAVASLLLIGCGNVSILLLARGANASRNSAVRAAVGADRFRIIRQLLTESLAIALAGTSLGVLLAWKSLSLITIWLPQNSIPAESVIKMNLPVLLFSVASPLPLPFSSAFLPPSSSLVQTSAA